MDERLVIEITAEIADLKKKVDEAKGEIQKLAKESESKTSKIKETFSKIGSAAKEGFKVVSAAISGAIASMVALEANTREYRASMAKLETAFVSVGSSADVAKNTYNELYRVLGDNDTATEAANLMAKLTTNEKDLAEWTDICKGVYATFPDSIPIEALVEASNETAKVGTITGNLADALNWAGVNEEAFQAKLDACNTEAEREALIRTTLTDLYGEAADLYEKNAKDVLAQNEAQIKLSESLATVGEVLQPVITKFTFFVAEALSACSPYIKELGEFLLPLVEEGFTLLGEAVQIGIEVFNQVRNEISQLGDKLEEVYNWYKEYETAIMLVGIAIGTLTTAIVAYNAVMAIKNAGGIVELAQLGLLQVQIWGLTAAQAAQTVATTVATAATTAFGAVMAFITSPITLVVLAIGALIAIIVLCVKHWDEIKETASKVAKTIADKVGEMKDKVVKFFTDLAEKAKQKIEDLKSRAEERFEALKTQITDKVQTAKENVVNKFNDLKTGVTDKINATRDKAREIFESIKSTITDKVNSVKTTVTTTFEAVKKAITSPVETAKNTVRNLIEEMKSFFKFEWSLPKLKLPHISISGEFSLSPPKVPKFSIDWYAKGGVFDSPTLFGYGNGLLGGLGEDGAEAIVPLEKNTEWLDRIAEKLASKQSLGNIYLQVDKKTFAEITCDSINQLTKQTGKIPLKVF